MPLVKSKQCPCGRFFSARTIHEKRRNYCNRQCFLAYWTGRHLSSTHKKAISKAIKLAWQRGDYSPNRKGSANGRYIDGRVMKAISWARRIIERDKACQRCGTESNLISHHIKPRKRFPELQFDLSNGQALCNKCHPYVEPNLPRIRTALARQEGV
jgi:hypothetical protein